MKAFSKAVIVEDNQMDAYVLKWHIDKHELAETVLLFSNGHEALNYFKLLIENPLTFPEIIFLDLNMPRLNGFEFLDQFMSLDSEQLRKIKIFIITSSNDAADRSKAAQYTFLAGYVVKPVDAEAFEKVMEVLKTHPSNQN